jgi:hypothetical protein
MLRSLQKFSRIELPATTSWVGVGEGQMEEDCGGGQGLTKGCGAKGRRRRRRRMSRSIWKHGVAMKFPE